MSRNMADNRWYLEKVEIRYSISIPIEEARESTRLLANATANLNQIAKYYNMGGLRSKEVQEQINTAVESIFGICRMVKEMSDKGYGNLKTPGK